MRRALFLVFTLSAHSANITFNRDVLPIFEAKCQSCHRPGEVAPMSLLTYEASRPWAKAIKSSVLTRKMPPWSRATVVFQQDAELVWFLPHMHLRGKDMTYRLIYPTGESETVLSVKYDFDWQLGYEVKQPIVVPKGTRLEAIAHFDNSANNRFNPDPSKQVWWGDQTWEEMMIPYFGVIVKNNANPGKIVAY
jgi:hypothetical protein